MKLIYHKLNAFIWNNPILSVIWYDFLKNFQHENANSDKYALPIVSNKRDNDSTDYKIKETINMNKTQKALFTLALGAAFFTVGKEKEVAYVQPTITEDVNFDSNIDLHDYDGFVTISRKYAEQVGLPEGIGL